MSQENPWTNQRFNEPDESQRFPNQRLHLCLEDTVVSLAEDGTSFYVIVDESQLRQVRNEKGRAMFGISVATLRTDAERENYLQARRW